MEEHFDKPAGHESHSERSHTQTNHEPVKPVHEPKHETVKPYHEPKPTVKPQAPKAGNPDKFWKTTTVVLIVILGIFLLRGGNTPAGNAVAGNPTAAAPSVPGAPAPSIDMAAFLDDDAVKGDPNAPVTIIEWSDFECPFCARFYSQTLSQIDEQYIKTGKVKLIYRDFPLSFHPQAQKAAEAAECAGEQGKYFEMHDVLFENGVQGGVASFKQFAGQMGLDANQFDTCLDSGEMAAEVQKDMNDGQRAGVQGTPGFLVNGQLVSGAQPFQVFQQVIEAELAN